MNSMGIWGSVWAGIAAGLLIARVCVVYHDWIQRFCDYISVCTVVSRIISGDDELAEFLACENNNVTHLNLQNINHMWSGMFAHLTGLQHITISGSMNDIPEGLFDGLKVQSIMIKRIDAITLPIGLFDKLDCLGRITIIDSAIKFMPHDIFSRLTCVQDIDISGNKLEYLPDSLCQAHASVYSLGNTTRFQQNLTGKHRELRLRIISDPLKSQYLNLYHMVEDE